MNLYSIILVDYHGHKSVFIMSAKNKRDALGLFLVKIGKHYNNMEDIVGFSIDLITNEPSLILDSATFIRKIL